MKPFFYRLLKWLQQLSDFHPPHFRHLDCIDLVLENKLLLLISWDAVHTGKISIRPGKAVYRQSTGAAVCRLPVGTDTIDVIMSNVWRSTKISLALKRIAVDHQTLQYINEHVLAQAPFAIKHLQPDFTIPHVQLKSLQPQIVSAPSIPVFNISINQFQFNDYAP